MPLTRERFLVLRAIKTLDKKVPATEGDRDWAVIQVVRLLLDRNATTYESEHLTTLQALMTAYQTNAKLPRKKANEDYP